MRSATWYQRDDYSYGDYDDFIAGRPKAALLFWFFGDLDVARCNLWLFSLYINIKIGKNSCLMLD